ncbi:MAG: hypothetical protein ACLFQS_11765 [Bacteroidales bacterium]
MAKTKQSPMSLPFQRLKQTTHLNLNLNLTSPNLLHHPQSNSMV